MGGSIDRLGPRRTRVGMGGKGATHLVPLLPDEAAAEGLLQRAHHVQEGRVAWLVGVGWWGGKWGGVRHRRGWSFRSLDAPALGPTYRRRQWPPACAGRRSAGTRAPPWLPSGVVRLPPSARSPPRRALRDPVSPASIDRPAWAPEGEAQAPTGRRAPGRGWTTAPLGEPVVAVMGFGGRLGCGVYACVR